MTFYDFFHILKAVDLKHITTVLVIVLLIG